MQQAGSIKAADLNAYAGYVVLDRPADYLLQFADVQVQHVHVRTRTAKQKQVCSRYYSSTHVVDVYLRRTNVGYSVDVQVPARQLKGLCRLLGVDAAQLNAYVQD